MFTFQENTHFSQALPCQKEVFWEMVRKQTTAWRIDTRRAIVAAVEASATQGAAALHNWLQNSEYQKFMLKKQNLKKESTRRKWMEKSDAERLLAFAQELKENLPAFIFCCREFDETTTDKGKPFRHRRLKDCHLNGLVMLDIDHVENPMQIWWRLRETKELMERTRLVHLTSSGQGIRVIFTADTSLGNLADNQIAFAQALGCKADDSCIDATRNSFAPKEEDILFIDENIFDYYDETFDSNYTKLYREKKTQPLHHDLAAEDEKDTRVPDPFVSWRGYDVQAMIDARDREKQPCEEDSNRHNESLKLASDLLILFDGDRQKTLDALCRQPWVQEIIDERNENVDQTVASAAEHMTEREKKRLNQTPSKAMQEAIVAVTGKTYQAIVNGEGRVEGSPSAGSKANSILSTLDSQLAEWGAEIEALSGDYPLISDITKGLKRNQYPAALFVAGGLMMTLMTRCTYRFYHRPEELRRLNCSALIIGDPASGKSFATRLYKQLAAPIVAADRQGKDAINKYREEVRSMGSNKEKPRKPKVVVRIHPARTSNAQFIQDMVNAVEVVDGEEMQLHMLTFDTELDNTVTVQRGGSWIDKQSMELKAFHNEEDGQAYSNNDSILQDFIVTWNFIYTGTPIALKKKVNERNFGSGLATRLTCIPLPATNFEMMERNARVDYGSDERLKTWAYRLDRMKGTLSVDRIVDELYDWTARRMDDARENGSKADEMLLKRCAYHGLNFAAPFIVMRHWDQIHQDGNYMTGEFETDETDWRLAELLTNIQYACQRHYFGAMAEKYFDDKERDLSTNVRHQQKTVEGFNRLPETFTVDDVMKCFGLNNHSAARTRVSRMVKDGLADKAGEYTENGNAKSMYKKSGKIVI